MLEIRGIWLCHMSRWDRYVLRPRVWAETSGSETVPHIGPYRGDVDDDLDDARDDDDDDGDALPFREVISPAESSRRRWIFLLCRFPPPGGGKTPNLLLF